MENPLKYDNKKKLAILMSTYNGEKYLSSLLDSLICQTNQDFTLYVRDDGSKDKTMDILNIYRAKMPNMEIIESDKNIGSKHSFLYLLQLVESELYMFCDQDDVWKPEKIDISVTKILSVAQKYNHQPIVVHTDLELVDGNLQTIAGSYWQYCHMPVDMPHDYELLCHFNDITGCAMIFNQQARDLTLPYTDIVLPYHVYHDYLVALVVAKEEGVIVPIHTATILFRRHGGNETNPLIHHRSILTKMYAILSYLREQNRRLSFYRNFKRQNLVIFVYYKCKTKLIQEIWKRKLA